MQFKSKELKKDLITKRCIDNDMTMDEAAKQIGISKATLSRLEKSKMPDVETFGKVCQWLGKKPDNYFEIVGKKQDGFYGTNKR
jgi:transcriptional regulator with XRE-family HTH domain